MNNTFELFKFFLFLNELNLIYQSLTGIVTSFNFIPIVLVPWDRFLLYHIPIRHLYIF